MHVETQLADWRNQSVPRRSETGGANYFLYCLVQASLIAGMEEAGHLSHPSWRGSLERILFVYRGFPARSQKCERGSSRPLRKWLGENRRRIMAATE